MPVYVEVEGPTVKGDVSVFAAATGKQIPSAWPGKRHGPGPFPGNPIDEGVILLVLDEA